MINTQDFNILLKKYAEVIVRSGVNVQEGHRVVLNIAVDQVQLAREIVEAAYEQGAKEVKVKWSDDKITRAHYLYQDLDTLTDIPKSRLQEMDETIDKKASRISIVSSDPDALNGIEGKKLAEVARARGKAFEPLRQATQANHMSWLVAAAAGPEWAAKVFPELSSTEEQVQALWQEIFKAVHLFDEDPVGTWKDKDQTLESKAEELNKEQFVALHYTGPGTDLTVGLPKGHRWEGAGSFNSRGERFMANMPTEEVFTAPDANRVDGVVVSTKPLSYNGSVIEGMTFHFKDGKVVDFTAEKGQEALAGLMDQDEGAKHLGEVALVPHASPISQSGHIFFNTLFDENASNHLALGSAYAFNLEGGTEMSQEALEKAGLNRSIVHVDFMIGSDQMDVDGIKADGSRVPVFRNGAWA